MFSHAQTIYGGRLKENSSASREPWSKLILLPHIFTAQGVIAKVLPAVRIPQLGGAKCKQGT